MAGVPQLLSIPEAAKALGLGSRNSVYALVARGELPVVTVGRVSRIDAADIESYIERNKRTAPRASQLRSA